LPKLDCITVEYGAIRNGIFNEQHLITDVE